jgi:glycosyltransferase involved in cell wall biosynthesis
MTIAMQVDAVMLTKNSLKPFLKECLDSIYKNMPISRLIVVDAGSVDGTVELLGSYPNVKIIFDEKGNRATSRQKGIDEVKTEWFAFIDSDVILCENWFDHVKPYLSRDRVGAVWGAALQRSTSDMARYRSMGRLYGKDELWIAVKAGRRRGLTHDTIIRTKAIEGIRIPSDLHVLEDHYIRQYVERKGYEWISAPKPYCFHYAHFRERPKDWYVFGQASKKTNFIGTRTILSYLFLGPYKSMWIYLNTGDYNAARIQYLTYLYIMKGWLNAVV